MTTYYVSPTGSDSAAGTSSGAPWLHPSRALAQMTTGDTLVIGGTLTNPLRGVITTNAANQTYSISSKYGYMCSSLDISTGGIF